MGQIDWFDVAPAIAFALVAGLMGRFVGGSSHWAVLAGIAYIIGAGFVAAAAVAFVGLDGPAGFVGSSAAWAVLIVPLWLYVDAASRKPVSEVEMDLTVAEGEAAATALPGATEHASYDAAAEVRSHFENLLWRLAPDAPRRPEIIAAKARLEDAMRLAARREPVERNHKS